MNVANPLERGDGVKLNGFIHQFELVDPDGHTIDRWEEHNLIPQVGLDFLIQSPFGLASPVAAFYLGLWKNNFVPSSSTVAADIPANMGEFLQYAEGTRPLWQMAYDGVGTIDNSASRAQFTFQQDQLIYGSFMVSNSTKGSNSGLLLSALRFSTAKQVPAGITLNLVCGLTYIPTNVI